MGSGGVGPTSRSLVVLLGNHDGFVRAADMGPRLRGEVGDQ